MLPWSIRQNFLPALRYHVAFQTFVSSIFEWLLKTGFIVSCIFREELKFCVETLRRSGTMIHSRWICCFIWSKATRQKFLQGISAIFSQLVYTSGPQKRGSTPPAKEAFLGWHTVFTFSVHQSFCPSATFWGFFNILYSDWFFHLI